MSEDRHKHRGLSWHPPGELAGQARAEATRQGVRLSSLLTAALAAYLDAARVESTPQVESTRAAPPKRAASKPAQSGGTECGHRFPDVRWVMGERVCRKCPT